jgi:hypothetical protein
MLDLKNTSVKAGDIGKNTQIDNMLQTNGTFWKPLVGKNTENQWELSLGNTPDNLYKYCVHNSLKSLSL